MTASGLCDIRIGTSSSKRAPTGFTSLSLGGSGFRVGAITFEKASLERASLSVRLPTNPVAPSSSSFIFRISHPIVLTCAHLTLRQRWRRLSASRSRLLPQLRGQQQRDGSWPAVAGQD